MRRKSNAAACLIGILGLFALSTGAAQAAPVTMQFTDAVIDLGEVKGVKAIDSSIPDPPATMSGDLTGTNVHIPKAGFVFPPKEAEVAEGITATINMEANYDISGTFDSATGRVDLDASLKATVAVLGSTCEITPIELALSTATGKPYLGVPYAAGLAGVGAIDSSWTELPPVTGGGACGVVAGLIAGPGGIWLANGIATPQTCADQPEHPGCGDATIAPTAAPKLTSSPPVSTSATTATFAFVKGDGETAEVTGFQCSLDSAAFEPCNAGSKEYTGLSAGGHTFDVKATNSVGEGPVASYNWTVTQPNHGKSRFSALRLAPRRKTVKRGKKVVIRAKVRNVGNARAAGVRICVNAPKRLVAVRKCIRVGSLPASRTVTKRFKVTVKKRARRGKRAVLRFKANGKGVAVRQARAVIRIR